MNWTSYNMFKIALVFIPYAFAAYYKPYPDIGLHESAYKCILDTKVNTETFESFIPMIQGMWGYTCGRNRGIFVLDPPDGHTYNCGKFPGSNILLLSW